MHILLLHLLNPLLPQPPLATATATATAAAGGPYRHPQKAYFRWTPHPVIVTVGDNRDYASVLLYSYDTTITGWEVLLKHNKQRQAWSLIQGFRKSLNRFSPVLYDYRTFSKRSAIGTLGLCGDTPGIYG